MHSSSSAETISIKDKILIPDVNKLKSYVDNKSNQQYLRFQNSLENLRKANAVGYGLRDNGVENASSLSSSTSLKNFNINSTNQSVVRKKRAVAQKYEKNFAPRFKTTKTTYTPSQHQNNIKTLKRQISNKNHNLSREEDYVDSEAFNSEGNTAINEFNLHTMQSGNSDKRAAKLFSNDNEVNTKISHGYNEHMSSPIPQKVIHDYSLSIKNKSGIGDSDPQLRKYYIKLRNGLRYEERLQLWRSCPNYAKHSDYYRLKKQHFYAKRSI